MTEVVLIRYGVGYHMTVVKESNCVSENVERLILSYVPNAKQVTDVGAELSFVLPSSGAAKFPEMFDSLDGTFKYSTSMLVYSEPCNMGFTQTELLMYISSDSAVQLCVFSHITVCVHAARKVELGVSSFGVSITTMEEVFIKVGEGTDETLETRFASWLAFRAK